MEIFGDLGRDVRRTTKADEVHLMAVGFEWIVPKVIEKSGTKQLKLFSIYSNFVNALNSLPP